MDRDEKPLAGIYRVGRCQLHLVRADGDSEGRTDVARRRADLGDSRKGGAGRGRGGPPDHGSGAKKIPSTSTRRSIRERMEEEAGAVKDRKSTRLNSSHVKSSYAVFCLK